MRDLLVYCESFKRWPASVDYAAWLAATLGGRLTGMYVCPSPYGVLAPYETPQLMTELLQAVQQLKDEACDACGSFESFARRQGASSTGWCVAADEVPRALALACNWSDLLVVGRTANTPWGSLSAVSSIVLGVNLPCIVVPSSVAGIMSLDRVAIAWNGSPEAVRAAHAALPLLSKAKQVLVLHGEQQHPANPAACQPPFDLFRHLAQHGIESESRMLPESGLIGEDILKTARGARIQLLVMGAYGHSRFREWILGGVTRHVLEHAAIPVFMHH